jgi:hypothetical protein
LPHYYLIYILLRQSDTQINFNKSSNEKIASVLCPGLGTLTGKLSPENCARQMKYAYDVIVNNKIGFPKDLFTAHNQHNILKNKNK